jgi:hypothetical protein
LFLLTLLGATWALQFVALQVVGDVASDQMTLWLVAAMFFPAIWSLVYGFTHRDSLKVVMWRPGRLAALIVAPLIPAVLAMSVLGVCLAAGWGISSYFEFPATGVNVLKGPSDSKITTQQDINRLLQQILEVFTAVSPNTFAPESNESKD